MSGSKEKQIFEVKGSKLSFRDALDWRVRRAQFICRVPPSVVREALQKVETLLDLSDA